MKISFIIPTSGQRKQALDPLIKDLSNISRFEADIILVGGVDDYKLTDSLKTINAPELASEGEICKMRNYGAKGSDAEILIFFDDDIELSPDWQNQIYPLLQKIHSGKVDIGTCRILGPNGRRWYDWNYASRLDVSAPTMLLPYGQMSNNLYVSGCCMIMTMRTWEQIRFDENRLNHQHDDVAFCHSALDIGKKFSIGMGARIKHLMLPAGRNSDDPASGSGNFPEMIYRYRTGDLTTAHKMLSELKNDLSESVFHYYNGMFFFFKQQYQTAKESFDKALQSDSPRGIHAQALYRSATCALARGSKKEYRQLLKEVLKFMPEHPHARWRVSRIRQTD